MQYLSLTVPAFFAGVLTFLAPCTLPLVPGYLGFIGGVSTQDLQNPATAGWARRKILLNGVAYVLGFSLVFIILGSLFGLGGAALIKHRLRLSRIGGVFVIFFGLFMLGFLKIPFLNAEKHFGTLRILRPGNPLSSLVLGVTFAFGWTPCIGPILASVLTLAASSATVGQGAFLLGVFSLGLAVPFLLTAGAVGTLTANFYLKFRGYLHIASTVGGVFLVFLGILLLTNHLGIWVSFFYKLFGFLNYDRILKYL